MIRRIGVLTRWSLISLSKTFGSLTYLIFFFYIVRVIQQCIKCPLSSFSLSSSNQEQIARCCPLVTEIFLLGSASTDTQGKLLTELVQPDHPSKGYRVRVSVWGRAAAADPES